MHHKDAKHDCAAAMRQLWDFLDEELTPDRQAAMREHIEQCKRCFPHYDWEKALLDALACSRPDCCAPTSLRERLVHRLREAGFTGCSR